MVKTHDTETIAHPWAVMPHIIVLPISLPRSFPWTKIDHNEVIANTWYIFHYLQTLPWQNFMTTNFNLHFVNFKFVYGNSSNDITNSESICRSESCSCWRNVVGSHSLTPRGQSYVGNIYCLWYKHLRKLPRW